MAKGLLEPSELLKAIAWGKQHGAFSSPLGQSLIRAWSVGAADESIEGMIYDMIRPLKNREAFGNLDPFRNPRLKKGKILLGTDSKGTEIRIPLQWLNAGLLIASNTGGGKSTLLIWLILQIAAAKSHVWATDLYKRQLRHLRPLLQRLGSNLIVLRPGDWKFNPLQPNSSNPLSQLALASDLLVRTLNLPSRAGSILRNTVHDLYRRYGIFEGRTDAYPCLFDVIELVRSARGLNAAARESILDRLGALLNALTPKCAAWRLGWNSSDLADFTIDFEMRGASEHVKQILLESALYSLLQNEVERGVVNAPLRLFVAFEDSQRFFDAQQTVDGGLTPMDELAGVVRGAGIGLGVNVQTVQGLSRKLVPNLATKIVGRLGSHEDYTRLGADMGMNQEQLVWAKHRLRPGLFIAQVAEGNWRYPFILSVPPAQIPTTVSDAEAARSVEALDRLPTVAAPEYANWPGRPPDLSDSSSSQTTSKHNSESREENAKNPQESSRPIAQLSKQLLDYLETIASDPFLSTTKRDKGLGLGGWKADRIRRQLSDKGLVETVAINPGGRGRRFQLLELTQDGRSLLKSLGVKTRTGNGRGGLEHQFWCHTIAEFLTSRGASCVIEDDSRGARVDIAVDSPQAGTIAIEVEISAGHEIENIRKDLSAGFADVVCLVKQPGRVATVRVMLADQLDYVASTDVHIEVGRLTEYVEILSPLVESEA